MVTGTSSGIGVITAREFAAAGDHVVLAVRNVQKGHEAATGMPGGIEFRQLVISGRADGDELVRPIPAPTCDCPTSQTEWCG